MHKAHCSAFTLVEILIVIVILGILAAVIVPSVSGAAAESAQGTTFSELQKIRRHVEMYMARNAGALPLVIDGSNGDWGAITGRNSEFLQAAPTNAWVGGENARRVVHGSAADVVFTGAYGWIFDPDTGRVWAAGFDSDDRPLPR